MTEEFDFIEDSTPAATPLDNEDVEEHVEEVLVEGEDVDVDGENVTVHEEIIEDGEPVPTFTTSQDAPSNFGFTALRYS